MTYKEYIKNYIKENNIKKYININTKIAKEFDEKIDNEECFFDPIETYNYLKAMEIEDTHYLKQLIQECEFDIIVNNDGTLSLEDTQGANLGDIESEKFETIMDICKRLEGFYFYDYYNIDIYQYEEEM